MTEITLIALVVGAYLVRDVYPRLAQIRLWKRIKQLPSWNRVANQNKQRVYQHQIGQWTIQVRGMAPQLLEIMGPWPFPKDFHITHNTDWAPDQTTFDELFVVNATIEQQTIYLSPEVRSFFEAVPSLSFAEGALVYQYIPTIRLEEDINLFLQTGCELADALHLACGNRSEPEQLAHNATVDTDTKRQMRSFKQLRHYENETELITQTARILLAHRYKDQIRCVAAAQLGAESLTTMYDIFSFGGNSRTLRLSALKHILQYADTNKALGILKPFFQKQLHNENNINPYLALVVAHLPVEASIPLLKELVTHGLYQADDTLIQACSKQPDIECEPLFQYFLQTPHYREEPSLYKWLGQHATSSATTEMLHESLDSPHTTRKQRKLIERTLLHIRERQPEHPVGQLSLLENETQGQLSTLAHEGTLSIQETQ